MPLYAGDFGFSTAGQLPGSSRAHASPSVERAVRGMTLTAIKRDIRTGVTTRRSFVDRGMLARPAKRRKAAGGGTVARAKRAARLAMADLAV